MTRPCASISEAIITGRGRIEVASDDASVPAALAVNLGLITTELVTNALEHAFPDGRPGKITVAYTNQNTSELQA